MSKCFCHLNGYEVKDAKARKEIELLKSLQFYKNKNILIVGDSLSDENLEQSKPCWVVNFREKIEAVGGSVTNVSVSGSSISKARTTNITTLLQSVPMKNYDYIIVFMGVNDWAESVSYSALKEGIDYFNQWKSSTYPNACVYFLTPPKAKSNFNLNVPLDYYRSMLVHQFTIQGYTLIDVFSEAPNYNGQLAIQSNLTTTDGLHFKPSYADDFSNYIFNRLQSQSSSYILKYVSDVICENFHNNKPLIIYYNSFGEITIYINLGSYTPTNNIIKLGTLPEWARPLFGESGSRYTSSNSTAYTYDFMLHTSGDLFLIFPESNKKYDLVEFKANYKVYHDGLVNL